MSNRMELHVRDAAVDLKSAINRLDLASLLERCDDLPGGRAQIMWDLGASAVIEPNEHALHYLYRAGYLGKTKEYGDFCTQELRHAGYHHLINARFLNTRFEPSPFFGRISTLARPLSALAEANMLTLPNPEYMKKFNRRLGVVETELGLLSAFSIMKIVEENFDAYLKAVPAYHYIWLYHFVEELEHVHVTFDHFENTFGHSLFASGESFIETSLVMEGLLGNFMIAAMMAAQHLEVPITARQILDTPASKHRQHLVQTEMTPDWKLDKFRDARRHYIELWDNKWEPAFKKSIEQQLAQ